MVRLSYFILVWHDVLSELAHFGVQRRLVRWWWLIFKWVDDEMSHRTRTEKAAKLEGGFKMYLHASFEG